MDFAYYPYENTSADEGTGKSQLLPNATRRETFVVVEIRGHYESSAQVTLRYMERGWITYTKGKVTHQSVEGTFEGEHSPTAQWDLLKDQDWEAIYVTHVAAALQRDELVGESRKRRGHDILWCAIRRSPELRAWIAKWFPHWGTSIEAHMKRDKDKRLDQGAKIGQRAGQ